MSSSVYIEFNAFQRMCVASGPDVCHARYVTPSGPGEEALASLMARVKSFFVGFHRLASALHGGPDGYAFAKNFFVMAFEVFLWQNT